MGDEKNENGAPAASDENASSSVHSSLDNFCDFELSRVLSENTQAKTITVLGNFRRRKGPAIVLLNKKCFIQDQLPSLLAANTSLKKEFHNDIYGNYDCQPPPELNGVSATVIHPATDKHIAKYEAKPSYAIEETPELYSSVTLPHLKEEQFDLQWVYNIIEGTAEKDRIVYASEVSEEKIGFVLVPDLKWDGKNLENLHLLALPYWRGILSLRDLSGEHLPLLKNIYHQGKKAIEEKFGIPGSRLRIYFHYQPSFYHLHVHFTALQHDAFGIHAGKAHLLSTVINNLELLPNYYKDSTLLFFVRESDNLFSKFEKHVLGSVCNLEGGGVGTDGNTSSNSLQESSKELDDPPTKPKSLQLKEMASKTFLRSVLCELRPRLRSGNVFLRTCDKLSKVEMSSKCSTVVISLTGARWSGITSLDFTRNLLFSPVGFEIDDDSVTISVVFEPSDRRVGSLAAEVLSLAGSVDDVIDSVVSYGVPEQSCQAKCCECGFSVWSDKWFSFKRILELPSAPIEEVIGEWFCHGHGDSKALKPSATDCYHDHLSTVVYLEDVAPGVLSCGNCGAWLGTVDKWRMCRLWGCTVNWVKTDGSLWLHLPKSPFEAFLKALKRSVHDEGSFKPVVKVLIESQGVESRSWVLLTILNGDLKVLLPIDGDDSECNVGKSRGKFGSGWNVLSSETGPEEDTSKLLVEWESHPNDLPFVIELHPRNMKRVLFKCASEMSDLNGWINQSDVTVLKVAEPMFKESLRQLERYNKLLPQSQRESEGFRISYLEL